MSSIDYQLSDDQNTLTRGNVQYQAINDTIFCRGCAFERLVACGQPNPHPANVRCAYPYRKDGRSIIWVKKYEN